jgi:GNAT superfamily N-acetyltransferase
MDDTLSATTAYRPTIRRVPVAAAREALAIIREAAAWATARGTGVWELPELCEDAFEAAARRSELVVGYAGETPAATMLLQTEDPVYWPDEAPGSALYVHKVAVRRAYAGQSWLARLIDFAVEDATRNGIPRLRLDTILRPRLQSLYEQHGFRLIQEPPLLIAGRSMIRMERDLGSPVRRSD